MKIKYKEPYWVKFQWDMSEHHDNQYVTEHDKEENPIFYEFLHREHYIINCFFKIKNHYKKDKINMVFGKPGKNLGLSYNSETKGLAYEFWTISNKGDAFNQIKFPNITQKEIETGVWVSIIRNGNRITVYKNFEESNHLEFNGNMVYDYKETSLFLGCSSPECESIEQRYHGEVDINHFSILINESDIEIAKDVCTIDTHNLLIRRYYDNLLCYYDFKTINNLGIVYDESKYSNFLEKVPLDYVK